MPPRLVVLGLGNPGVRYRTTRHNVGFWVVDLVADSCGASFDTAAALGSLAWVAETGTGIVLAKPRTYMNNAGLAAAALCGHYAVSLGALLVVYDDADLALGRLRIRPNGRAGGHRGVRSIIDTVGSESFGRVRLGVRGPAREAEDLADYVLGPFPVDEEPVARRLARLAAEAVGFVADHGLESGMNRYNGQDVSMEPDSGEGLQNRPPAAS